MLYRVAPAGEGRDVYATLYAQRMFFLVTLQPRGAQFEVIPYLDARHHAELNLARRRRDGRDHTRPPLLLRRRRGRLSRARLWGSGGLSVEQRRVVPAKATRRLQARASYVAGFGR